MQMALAVDPPRLIGYLRGGLYPSSVGAVGAVGAGILPVSVPVFSVFVCHLLS